MPTLPWTAPRKADPPTGELVVMASRFKLQHWRDVAPFFLAALKIRGQMLRSPGIAGVSLIAKPTAKTFYTLSSWQDRDSLDASVTRQPHLTTMQKFGPRTQASVFAFWSAPAGARPDWDDAHRRLNAEATKTRHGEMDHRRT
jgi:hypothetical protein